MSDRYDIVLWAHGPEILEKPLIKTTIDKLLKKTKKYLVMMCPWGKYSYEDGEEEGLRSSDINRTALYPDDFLRLGFNVSTIGEKDVNGSNLLAWRYVG